MHETIARFRFLAGKSAREERLAQQRQILVERKALHQRNPKEGQFQREVGASAGVAAEVLLETGHADAALAVVEEILPALEKLVHDDKPDSSQPSQLDSRNYIIRRVWAELLARKGEALARTGKAAGAGKAIRQAIEITEDLSKQEKCYLYDLARHLTLASTLPGGAGVTKPADRAVKALSEYMGSGFDNPYKLHTDPRLESAPQARRLPEAGPRTGNQSQTDQGAVIACPRSLPNTICCSPCWPSRTSWPSPRMCWPPCKPGSRPNIGRWATCSSNAVP